MEKASENRMSIGTGIDIQFLSTMNLELKEKSTFLKSINFMFNNLKKNFKMNCCIFFSRFHSKRFCRKLLNILCVISSYGEDLRVLRGVLVWKRIALYHTQMFFLQ